MVVTDQPGRVAALVAVAPFLLLVSMRLDSLGDRSLSRAVGALAVVFWLYELFWICNYPPKRIG